MKLMNYSDSYALNAVASHTHTHRNTIYRYIRATTIRSFVYSFLLQCEHFAALSTIEKLTRFSFLVERWKCKCDKESLNIAAQSVSFTINVHIFSSFFVQSIVQLVRHNMEFNYLLDVCCLRVGIHSIRSV